MDEFQARLLFKPEQTSLQTARRFHRPYFDNSWGY